MNLYWRRVLKSERCGKQLSPLPSPPSTAFFKSSFFSTKKVNTADKNVSGEYKILWGITSIFKNNSEGYKCLHPLLCRKEMEWYSTFWRECREDSCKNCISVGGSPEEIEGGSKLRKYRINQKQLKPVITKWRKHETRTTKYPNVQLFPILLW